MPLNCPIDAEEIAERYAMAKLGGEDLARFEQHLLTCSRCTELVRQALEFIEAVKSASRELKSSSSTPQQMALEPKHQYKTPKTPPK
jgi:anti-sigma factor RsiW